MPRIYASTQQLVVPAAYRSTHSAWAGAQHSNIVVVLQAMSGGAHTRLHVQLKAGVSIAPINMCLFLINQLFLRTADAQHSNIVVVLQAMSGGAHTLLHAQRNSFRQRGDSNPCGQSPMDFESISLAARTHCLKRGLIRWLPNTLPHNAQGLCVHTTTCGACCL